MAIALSNLTDGWEQPTFGPEHSVATRGRIKKKKKEEMRITSPPNPH